jgi:hypothetical protein
MKSSSSIFCLLISGLSLGAAAARDQVERVRLDDRLVITVPVATNRVTTLCFPSAIAAIDAAGVSTDPNLPALFQMAHSKGTSFVSVRAMIAKAASNLNIRWNNRTYVFELVESLFPVLALNLEDKPIPVLPEASPVVSPARLLALLDKAKAFPLLKEQHPESVAQVEVRTFGAKPLLTDFSDYQIHVEEIFRFNPEDTLVFHVTLKNRSSETIRYAPDTFSVKAGDRLYSQSISDAPGILPPNTECTVYFAITGTPDGGRNELSLKNEFTILVQRLTPSPPLPPPNREPLPVYPEEGRP